MNEAQDKPEESVAGMTAGTIMPVPDAEAGGPGTSHLDGCAREPIRIPGGIQPHGVLICLSEPALQVSQYSDNLGALLGVVPAPGIDIGALLGDGVAAALRGALSNVELESRPLLLGRFVCGMRQCDAIIHRHQDRLFLELEPADGTEDSFAAVYALVRTFVAKLQQTISFEELCQLATRELRAITGFGRTLLYRFDAEGHGEVLSEDCAEGYDSYMHHRFPASDIPRQARELYRVNHLRLIPNADYTPARLVPECDPRTGTPIDLSFAVLRSVSPVHLEYMRNMGTYASMSVSIIVRGQLWGLISCHNHEPRHLPYSVRTACEHLGQIVSLQIEAKEDHHEVLHRLDLRQLLVSMLSTMADSGSSPEALLASPDEMLKFANASGAAVIQADHCSTIGTTPSLQQLLSLADWLALQGKDVFATDRLAELFPEASAYRENASGILAVAISQLHRSFVIWFRPEVVQTILWAGEPQKRATEVDSAITLRPRLSFESWREELKGRSLPWRPSEETTAAELRNALLGIVLKKAEQMASLATELGRINKELESFSYSVSHDLRAPLRHISSYADLLAEQEGAAISERGMRFLKNIKASAKFAGTLVDDLLSYSQMGRASLKLTRIDLKDMVEHTIRTIELDAAGRNIEWNVHDLPRVNADPVFMQVVLQNLLSNAVKYTATRDPARIEISSEDLGNEYEIRIADNGVGFNMKYVNKLFGVFQRLHSMDDFEGTGIGLANVRRVIERHGGTVRAEGETGKGATFWFRLPKKTVTKGEHDAQANSSGRRQHQ